ncbi:MAG: 2-oxoacid:acceptor oxidoreductase subunit alpha [Betaproteobacteria bacterium]|nr:2-oxoacid:acceptor oxidoreductase subunit alpha [Betaproteobacteria bacterium]
MGERRLMLGNEAFCEGAIAAGVRFFAGYPITPATEIFEAMSRRLPGVGGVCIQMEDEIASIHACMGASLVGVKAITATSGIGFSLMQGGLGDAAASEIPIVVINVQRVGPGAGVATASAQMDFMQSRWGSNGDYMRIVLAPSTVSEAHSLTIKAVNFSERFRVPVVILTELFLGLLRDTVETPDPGGIELQERPRPSGPVDGYLTYDARTVNDVPPMADVGSEYRATYFYQNGAWRSTHVPDGYNADEFTRDKGVQLDFFIRRIHEKVLSHRDEVVMTEATRTDDAEILVVAYGIMAQVAKEAVHLARQQGIRMGLLKLTTVWPFPDAEVRAHAARAKAVIVPEMSRGQLLGEVGKALNNTGVPILPLQHINTRFITPQEIIALCSAVAR